MRKRASITVDPLQKYFILFLIGILILFFLLRFLHLPESLGFGSDAGRDFLRMWTLVQEKSLTLIGPSSQYSVEGRYFYFGPAPYYIMIPALIAGSWDVLFAAKYLIILNAICLTLSLFILQKSLKRSEIFMVYSFAVLCSVTPLFIEYSRTYWNPYFVVPVSILVSSSIFWIRHRGITTLNAVLLGFLFGLGMQFHYSYILAIGVSVILLIIFRKLSIKSCLNITLGFILGFLPLFLFELRNNFHNIRTVFFVLNNGGSQEISGIPFYYYICLLPFFFLLVSWMLMKLYKNKPIISLGFLIIYSIVSLIIIIPKPTHGFDMADNWNYPALMTTADIIKSDNPRNYNIVDQLSGDNRAMSLRYILTTMHISPLGTSEYKDADLIYVFSHEPIDKLLKDPVWEIATAGTKKKVKEWKINEDIMLYKLE